MMAEEKDTDIKAPTAAEVELEENQRNYDKMMAQLKTNVWGHSQKGLLALKASMHQLSLKTGMYARIPIYCKGEHCPYNESCQAFLNGLAPENEPCPTEVALIGRKVAQYTDEFDLDKDDASPTDKALVEEIILMEVSMERCKALMSQEINPIQNVAIGLSEDGDPIYQPQVSKVVEAYERFSKKRNADYNLLMATRKDKKKDVEEEKQADIYSIIEEAQNTEGFFDMDKRPDVQDAEFTESEVK